MIDHRGLLERICEYLLVDKFFGPVPSKEIIPLVKLYFLVQSKFFVLEHLTNVILHNKIPDFFNSDLFVLNPTYEPSFIESTMPLRGPRRFRYCICSFCCQASTAESFQRISTGDVPTSIARYNYRKKPFNWRQLPKRLKYNMFILGFIENVHIDLDQLAPHPTHPTPASVLHFTQNIRQNPFTNTYFGVDTPRLIPSNLIQLTFPLPVRPNINLMGPDWLADQYYKQNKYDYNSIVAHEQSILKSLPFQDENLDFGHFRDKQGIIRERHFVDFEQRATAHNLYFGRERPPIAMHNTYYLADNNYDISKLLARIYRSIGPCRNISLAYGKYLMAQTAPSLLM